MDDGRECEQTTETIQKYFNLKGEFGSYVADPHTAVGLAVANRVAAKKYVCPSLSLPLFHHPLSH